ncbi:GCG_CRPN prefix-to-repeats domain-containing protein [Methylobacterium radiodurans]|uniref:Sulfur globule protein n=1 Tax=Methylobacterium radiodurans TaxID=2202828 RepID=A0A2U8VXD7_9HYPH|nr:hypothetical protein [Methylobacterium radiodurans]AWN38449.1 hypothetical protein DK427_24205 [Methylobacterium radiodurans]
MRMKLAGAALLALGTLAGTANVAEAAQGCGPGFHRGYYGWCRPHWRPYAYRPAYYARPVVYGYGWRRPWGWRHAGWHHRHWGWRHAGWHRRW